MAPHAGVIIAASVLVAASLAAYENPQIREWFEKSSQKVALAFRALGDDINGRKRARTTDLSMHEDEDEKAEERRRLARQEIMEKGRALQEKRKRPQSDSSRTPSFDSLVDEDGKLREHPVEPNPWAASSAIEREESSGLRSRHDLAQAQAVVNSQSPHPQVVPEQSEVPTIAAIEPWESQYEQEMRSAWNLDLPPRDGHSAGSHLSESLIDMTPRTEDFPDPDYSIPSLQDMPESMDRSGYFSAHASQNLQPQANQQTHSTEDALTHSLLSLDAGSSGSPAIVSHVPSAHASVASSTIDVGHSDAELTEDDDMSDEFGDGIRTPGSVWTEVASSVSGDELT